MSDLRRLVQRISVRTDRVIAPPDGITILIYHRVGAGTDSAVDLDADDFERQLEHLREHHRILSLPEAVERLSRSMVNGWAASATNGRSASSRGKDVSGVVLTFDDGTDDFTDVVMPIAERHRVPVTLYAATGFIESGEPFPWGARPTSWDALRDACSTGLLTIGSHTHDHRLLHRADPETAVRDLDRSIELLGARLTIAAEHFAYPKAVPGSAAAEIAVRRRFRSAALARSRVNRPGRTDVHRLWRTPVTRRDDAEHFARKAAGGLRLEGELRALQARVRYRRHER